MTRIEVSIFVIHIVLSYEFFYIFWQLVEKIHVAD